MKKIGLLLILFLLTASFAVAHFSRVVDQLAGELEGQEIPSPLGMLFGDEKINVHLSLTNGEEMVVGVITEDDKVKSIDFSALEEVSLNVYASEEAITKIQNSDDQLSALKEAMDDDEISYKAVGFGNKIKFAFASVFSKIAGLFTGEEVDNVDGEDEIEENGSVEADTVFEEIEEVDEVEEPTGAITHPVPLINTGFDVNGTLEIKVGDSVEWHNIRTGTAKKAMMIGGSGCNKIKSGVFNPGESFSWTFEEAGSCTIIGGIYTTATMKIKVQ